MSRRMLVATALATASKIDLVGSDDKPLVTDSSIRDAAAHVKAELEQMAKKYLRDGWAGESSAEQPGGEPTFELTAEDIVVGRYILVRN